jgi:hypothetical protein
MDIKALIALAGRGFSPASLDTFAVMMKGALMQSEGVPQYVLDSAEGLRQAIMRWSEETKAKETKKTA